MGLKSVPEVGTRLAMLKTGEADIAVALDCPEGLEVKRDPRLQLVSTRHASIFWIEFAEQWDPKSPWHDKRVRQAVNFALDRKTTNEAACLGFCPPARVIVPRVMDFALQVDPGRRAGSSCLASWTLRCRSSHRPTIRRRRSSNSPRPAIPTGSTPETSWRFPDSPRWRRPR